MSGVRDEELVKFPGFPGGIDHVSPDHAIPEDRVREAINIDFDNAGKPRTRPGARRILNLPLCHSLFAIPDWDFMFMVTDDKLVAITVDGEVSATLQDGFSSRAVSYTVLDDVVYLSDGINRLKVFPDQTVEAWGIDPPTLSGNGLQGPLVVLTFLRADGEESAPSVPVTVEDGVVTLPTISTDPQVTMIRVYATAAEGEELFAQAEVPLGMATYTLREIGFSGRPLHYEFAARMPAGHIVRHYNGRIYVAVGDTLYWSEPQYYGVTVPDQNFVRFSDTIDIVEPIDRAGIYVVAGQRTYFMAGAGPEEFVRSMRHPHGAIRGTSLTLQGSHFGFETDDLVAYWWSEAGYPVIGLPDRIVPVRKDQIASDIGDVGTTFLQERQGIRSLVTNFKPVREGSGLKFTETLTGTVTKVDPPA